MFKSWYSNVEALDLATRAACLGRFHSVKNKILTAAYEHPADPDTKAAFPDFQMSLYFLTGVDISA